MVCSGTYVYKYTWVLWFLLVLMCINIMRVMVSSGIYMYKYNMGVMVSSGSYVNK